METIPCKILAKFWNEKIIMKRIEIMERRRKEKNPAASFLYVIFVQEHAYWLRLRNIDTINHPDMGRLWWLGPAATRSQSNNQWWKLIVWISIQITLLYSLAHLRWRSYVFDSAPCALKNLHGWWNVCERWGITFNSAHSAAL